MKIILIGASGFLGQRVSLALSSAGHECVILTRQPARRQQLKMIPRSRLVQADVYDPQALTPLFAEADAVVSMAGILNEKGFNGQGFHRVHVELVERILEACEAAGLERILHVSALNAGQGEGDETSHYLRTKGEAEALLRQSGAQVSIFQPSVIFGPGDSFFNRFAALLKLFPVMPLACAEARMQPVYVGDVAQIMASALKDQATHGETFELGGPTVYSLGELVAWTAAQLGLRRWTPGLPDFASRLQGRVMDFVPGKPFSTDNYRSLQLDNVTRNNALPAFGIQPASIEAIVPTYLGVTPKQQHLDTMRRRAGGQ